MGLLSSVRFTKVSSRCLSFSGQPPPVPDHPAYDVGHHWGDQHTTQNFSACCYPCAKRSLQSPRRALASH